MKTLYESILDSDIMGKADKSAGMFLLIWDPLKKGLHGEYNASRVKRNIKDAIEKYDLLPHDDEWPELVKWFNAYLGMKCVEEPPIKYKLYVTSSLNSRVNRSFYSVEVYGYWRTQHKKNGEVIPSSIITFRYDPLGIKPRVIQVGTPSDKKWVKRLADKFNKKPEFDDKGDCQFVL